MSTAHQVVYEFGQFTLAPAEKRLVRDGKVVPLAPKVFDTLVLLVRNQGRLVEKDELLRTLWPNSIVEEVGLAHNVSQLRKVLGDTAEDPRFIETVPKRGYRFVAAVREGAEPQVASPAPAADSGQAEAGAAARSVRWPRAAIAGASAVLLALAAGTGAYLYLSSGGIKAARAIPAIHSLAVLPFENLSGDKEQAYFADGMTDELITELGTIGALRVVSRTSVMRYQGSRKPLRDIAAELKVDGVVEGTVLRSGNRVRITAQLIDATGDRNLWARGYEGNLSDVLALQDHVSRDIAAAIRIKLTPHQRAKLSVVRSVDPEAHDDYLRGRYWLSGIPTERFASGDNARRGLDFFRKAIARDPNYALAYAGLADAFLQLAGVVLPPEKAIAGARDALTKALQLDPSIAEAHVSLASIALEDWDWPAAHRELLKALALNPNYASAHELYSSYLCDMGKVDESVKEAELARDLNPFSPDPNINLGLALYSARRYDDALRQFHRGLEMYPRLGIWNFFMAWVYEQKKMFPEAFAQYHQSIRLNKETQRAEAVEQAYKRSGYKGAVRQMIGFETQNHALPLVAHGYAVLGDDAHAMLWLERAYQQRGFDAVWLNDPALDHLRGTPRFRDLVRRIGLPPSLDHVPVEPAPDHAAVP
jgi:TolB-like protein/DNA-binding winged helix-turn-helix (wHTH) protein/Tfp pilus assembly protein PilF